MPVSMRSALDKINAEEKRVQKEREAPDRERLGRISASQEAVKGKSVTSVKSAKERYDEYMKENAPKTGTMIKTGLAGLVGGPVGFGLAAAKIMGSYIKASGVSRDQAIADLESQGISTEEAESVVNAAIRGNPDITPEQIGGTGERHETRTGGAQDQMLQEVVQTMTGGQQPQPYRPAYTPGIGYAGGGYQGGGAPVNQFVGPQNQIVQASQQGLQGFGGMGPQQVIPQNAQQFTQTPDMQQPMDFWSIASQLAMENK